MIIMKNNFKALSCSTPEQRRGSTSKDSDSLCDSDAASPVPFLCTQDGTEGETDVVWNFYTPKSGHSTKTQLTNTTPLSRKSKRSTKSKIIEQPIVKRRATRAAQKKTELFQELIELNQNLHQLIDKKIDKRHLIEKQHSGSEDDIFSDSSDHCPKNVLRTSSKCLRKNLLSSKFPKPETETALESDDSMNECLLKASQIVEETITKCDHVPIKKTCYDVSKTNLKKTCKQNLEYKMNHDSMDSILNGIKLDSPTINKVNNCDSPCLRNDSFDCLVGNLNESVFEQLTQMPLNKETPKCESNSDANWTVKDVIVHDGSPSSKSFFSRHNSMPESPTIIYNKPSTSGMVFGRYNSMPSEKHSDKNTEDVPIRCTPDEIKRKHQQARDKLLAKRLLPFTATQQTLELVLPVQKNLPLKKSHFQPRVASSNITKLNCNQPITLNENIIESKPTNSGDLKLLIEKKRQEALMKLRRKHPQNKSS